MSLILAGLMRLVFRLKASASFSANSCLLTLVAPAVCKMPLIFLSVISSSISAKFVLCLALVTHADL